MSSTTIYETDAVQQIRQHSFSHWVHIIPSQAQMIEAGFFNCNVGDRVICIYCNLICHQWTSVDDPCEVHKILSPKCPYAKLMLIRREATSMPIGNETMMGSTSDTRTTTSDHLDLFRCNEFAHTGAYHTAYIELSKRTASFATWSSEKLPSVEDLVRAGFFYTGTKSIVTCFYCNGSLQNWGANDNPTVEHARWLPHCAYAKQLCGAELYRKIQESKRAQQERVTAYELDAKMGSVGLTDTNAAPNTRQLSILDGSTLSRFATARLDPLISQNLSAKSFKLSINKRSWENPIRLKKEYFATKYDLLIANVIQKKYIEYIDGREDNIIIPNIWMTKWKENQGTRDVVNFIEDEVITIQREQSFTNWPYWQPSRFDMVTTGWFLIRTDADLSTICFHCDARYDRWNVNTNPYLIHRQLSPFCPFIRASYPSQSSAVPIRPIDEVFTQQRIAADANRPCSNVIIPSNLSYSCPCDREKSFYKFPRGYPRNGDALIKSGFYYTGLNTIIRCYHCRVLVNNLHLYPSHEIDTEHRRRSPVCQIARLLADTHTTTHYNSNNQCEWCCKKPKKFIIHPCMDFAICDLCASMVRTCPVCGTKAQDFIKIFS